MSPKTTIIGAVAALALATTNTHAFSPVAFVPQQQQRTCLFSEESKPTEAVFMPEVEAEESAVDLDAVEKLGRGAAKVRKNFDSFTEPRMTRVKN
jgi:hypothetical protein